MYTEEELEKLAEEEDSYTEEAIAALLITLGITERELKKEIRNFYATYGKDGVITYSEVRKWVSNKDHTRRLVALNQLMDAIFEDSFNKFTIDFRNHFRKIILEESKFFKVKINADDILDIVWATDGIGWNQRLWMYRDQWMKVLCNDFKISFLKRENLTDVLDSLGDRFNSMEKILRRFTVSESTAMRSLARREIFTKLGVEKYQFYTRADERTCETCGALHGHIFPMEAFETGVTASPLHSYCRCWEVPIMD